MSDMTLLLIIGLAALFVVALVAVVIAWRLPRADIPAEDAETERVFQSMLDDGVGLATGAVSGPGKHRAR